VAAAFFIFLLIVALVLACINWCKTKGYQKNVSELWAHTKLLTVMALCDPPPPPEPSSAELIPVCFNAWEYAGKKHCNQAITCLVSHLK